VRDAIRAGALRLGEACAEISGRTQKGGGTVNTVIGIYLVVLVVGLAGWINNVIWTFHQSATVDLILGVVGILAAPIGAVHGVYLWFA
jgi:hypothetical protein